MSWALKRDEDPKARELVHKLFHRPEYALYDLEKDPHELHDVASDPKYKVVLERLRGELHKKLKALGDGDPILTEMNLKIRPYRKSKARR